jgi:hypothetical protein
MTISNLQLGSANNASPGAVGSSGLAYAANCTPGSLLVCVLSCSTTGLTLGVSDSVNGAWTQAVATTNANATVGIFFFAGNASAAKPTVTCTQSGTGSMRFALEEWAGIATTSALDQTASATPGSGTSPSSGNTSATTVANELVIGGISGASGTPTITAGGSATLDLNLTGRLGMEYQIVSSTGAQSAAFTYGTADFGAVVCATFKAAVVITNLQLGSANNKSPGAVTSSTLAYAANCTVGSLLVCALQVGTGGAGITLSVSDSVNGAWTLAEQTHNNNDNVALFYFANNQSAAKPTVTCTQTGGPGTMRFALEEWSGLAGAPLDQVASNASNGTTTSPSSGNTPTTTGANELVIGAISGASGVPTITAGGSATLDLNLTGRLGMEYQIVSGLGAQAAAFVYGTADSFAAVCATFRTSAGTPYSLACAYGVYAYTGEAAILTWGPTNYTLLCAPGNYNYEGGQSSADMAISPAVGVYGYVGIAAGLIWSGAAPPLSPAPSSLKHWIPFSLACRLRCLQQGSLNVGNTRQNIAHLMTLALAQIASPSNPPWAKYTTAVNQPKEIYIMPYLVPGFVPPPDA